MTGAFSARHLGPPAVLPYEFELDDQLYVLPELPTRVWLDVLTLQRPGCWWLLLPTQLVGGDRLYARLYDPDDGFDLDDAEQVAEQVLTAVLGVAFDPACRLAAMAWGNWLLFDGWCASVGFDPLAAPIPRVLAAVYAWRRSLCVEQADLTRLDGEVWVTSPAVTVTGRSRLAVGSGWREQQQEAAFLGFLATMGSRG